MSTSIPPDFNEQVIEEFRANQGRVGGMFDGMTLLLLHDQGAKSGKAHIHPLAYHSDDGRYVILASKGGAPTNPAWYHNLKANPVITAEVGARTLTVVAEELDDSARAELWPKLVARFPSVGVYQATTARQIPVFILTRMGRERA